MWIIEFEGRNGLAEYSTFLNCVSSDVSSNGLPQRVHAHIGCICLTFLHCVFSVVFIVWSRGCKVTLVAFVCLFPCVYFQMCPQRTKIRAGVFTLVALVWLFFTVCFQMCLQMTFAHSHWLHLFVFSPQCFFKCVLNELGLEQAYSHGVHLFDFSPSRIFRSVLISLAWADE